MCRLATHEDLYQMLCEHSDISAACVLFLLATTSFNTWKTNYRSKARTDRRQVLVQPDRSTRPANVMMHEGTGSPPRNSFTNNTRTERVACTLHAVEDDFQAKAATATALEQRCSRLQLELGAARDENASEVSSAVTATNERWLRFHRTQRDRTTTAVSWLRWVLAEKRAGAAAVQAAAKQTLQAASAVTIAVEKRAGIIYRELQAEGKTCATLRNCLAKSRQKESRASGDARKMDLENARLMASLRNERARYDYTLKDRYETESAVMTGLRNGMKENHELLTLAEQAAARQAKSTDDLRARVDQLTRELVATQADAHTSREQASKEISAVQSSALAESERAAAVIIALREEAVASNAAATEAATELRTAVAAANDERDAAIAARDDARSTAEELSRALRGCQEDLVRAQNDAASTAANGPQGIDDDTDDTKGGKRCREACDEDHDVRDDFDDDDDDDEDTAEDATSEDDDQTENNATPSNGLAHAKKPRRRNDDGSAGPSLTYGELHALTRASPIVSFFLGGADRKGRYVNQLIAMTDESLEAGHDYIQYIFPTMERSRFARDAPVVNDNDMPALFAHQRPVQETMLRSFCRMLEFYGLELFEDGRDGSVEVEKGPNFDPHARWMTYHGDTPDHNALRLTRILTSLRLFSLERYADALKIYLLQSLPQLSRHPSRAYWERA